MYGRGLGEADISPAVVSLIYVARGCDRFASSYCLPQGFLTPEQLIAIMQDAELGLTGPELHLVIAEADDNADGSIDVRFSTPPRF